MEKYLNRNIKGIIDEFPILAKILQEYNIGCVTCALGTCPLKDIVEIHNISPEQESELLTKIASVLYPNQKITFPIRKRATLHPDRPLSPPLRALVAEHILIKRVLAFIPDIIDTFDINSDAMKNSVMECIDFIRNFADAFHHAKEEDILFKFFDPETAIIKAMLSDHVTGRNHVRNMISGLESSNGAIVADHLNGYRSLLSEHIKKEDEILYPWMDRNLNDNQIGQLFSQFALIDERFGTKHLFYEQWVSTVESTYGNKQSSAQSV